MRQPRIHRRPSRQVPATAVAAVLSLLAPMAFSDDMAVAARACATGEIHAAAIAFEPFSPGFGGFLRGGFAGDGGGGTVILLFQNNPVGTMLLLR